MKERLASYAPFILVGVYPLGMALQNIGSALALLFLLPLAWENRDQIRSMNSSLKFFLLSFLLWMLIAVVSTLLNGSNVDARFGKFIGGYLGFFITSCLFLPSTC